MVWMEQARDCRLCGNRLAGATLDLGDLPPCNRFEATPAPLEMRRLAVAGCGHCGLVQLTDCPPLDFTRPRVPWIRYNEPDAHLDDVASHVARHGGASRRAVGIGPFDAPL